MLPEGIRNILRWRGGRSRWASLRVASLTLTFILAFALPIYLIFALKGGTLFRPSRWSLADAVSFARNGEGICVEHAPDLNPQAGRDFLISGWFKLKELPRADRRMFLLSKLTDDRVMNGYVLALERDGDLIRPAVFWRDASGRGNWRSFSEISIAPDVWFMLSLSFYEGRYLGIHFALRQAEQKIQPRLVGGYELGDVVIPGSESPLCTGMTGSSGYRGALGMLSVFSPRGLGKKLNRAVKDLARQPGSIPREFSKSEAVLLIRDGQSDSSARGHRVRKVKAGGKKHSSGGA